MINLILASLTVLSLALPSFAKTRLEEFPVDSPTKAETPAERKERQERERYTKADAQRIRKAQNDWEKRQREYEREEEKLKGKSTKDEKQKNKEEAQKEAIYGNQIRVEILTGKYRK